MDRRSLLSIVGSTGVSLVAGCLGFTSSETDLPTNNDSLPQDQSPNDGYPPQFEHTPTSQSIDVDSFDTLDRNGVAVPLAPIKDVYYWYVRRDARFVDTRPKIAWERSRIYGAVWSPAPNGHENDLVDEWSKSDRIVCYCGCPHTLSSIRAASLLKRGYENVYVIDEGFWKWHEFEYPMAGTTITARPAPKVIRGRTSPKFAGQIVWLHHPSTGQREATPIAPDGMFRFEFRFTEITERSILAVETPTYRLSAELSTLTTKLLTPSHPAAVHTETAAGDAIER